MRTYKREWRQSELNLETPSGNSELLPDEVPQISASQFRAPGAPQFLHHSRGLQRGPPAGHLGACSFPAQSLWRGNGDMGDPDSGYQIPVISVGV